MAAPMHKVLDRGTEVTHVPDSKKTENQTEAIPCEFFNLNHIIKSSFVLIILM